MLVQSLTPTLLVIQNAATTASSIPETLASLSYDLHIVTGPSELQAVLSGQNPDAPMDPDLILCESTQTTPLLFEALKKNSRFSNVPVILFGEREGVRELLQASLPIDDYVILPIEPFDLKTRIQLRLRHGYRRKDEMVRVGNLRLHPQLMRASILQGDAEEPLPLTHKEFKILALLIRNKNRPFTRFQLLEAVWGGSIKVLDRTVDSHICALRRKLKEHAQYIECISGVGYRFRLSEDEAI